MVTKKRIGSGGKSITQLSKEIITLKDKISKIDKTEKKATKKSCPFCEAKQIYYERYTEIYECLNCNCAFNENVFAMMEDIKNAK